MMTRREFLCSATAVASLSTPPPTPASAARPEIAFTFDDPTTNGGAGLPWRELNGRILDTLATHNIRSVLFVCGMRVDSEAGHELITSWDHRDHLIGNHSYSHLYFDKVTLREYAADMLKNEPLIASYSHSTRLFRYPYFKEGNTEQKRDGMRSLLQQHGYRLGRATIDASDWAINARLEARLKQNPQAELTGYREFFLQHIWERSVFYQSLAQRVLQHPVRHTVLLHHSTLNALFLGDLIGMFIEKGWRPVDAQYAYQDPVYDRQPKTLPAGEGLIWALAKETGTFESELRYPAEDDIYENPKMDALKL
jgi:peptidoglycan/xylan/chitin deacetylase (PgdA/CDA1 family)